MMKTFLAIFSAVALAALGCYGGEIKTPNPDRLAAEGLRFTQSYNTARCWPSRGSLLTGYYPQPVRRDKLSELKLPPGAGAAGNGGVHPRWAQLLPVILKPLGYRSHRLARLKKPGIFQGELSPLDPAAVPNWNLSEEALRKRIGKNEVANGVPCATLTPGQKEFQAAKMSVHAATIHRMDIGTVREP